MDELKIEPTKYTPAISFDAKRHVLEISGMSYPPDVAETYGPFFAWLDAHLGRSRHRLVVNIDLSYLNSSSYRVMLRLFERLEKETKTGMEVVVNWIYDPEDYDKLELGEEFRDELSDLVFHLREKVG